MLPVVQSRDSIYVSRRYLDCGLRIRNGESCSTRTLIVWVRCAEEKEGNLQKENKKKRFGNWLKLAVSLIPDYFGPSNGHINCSSGLIKRCATCKSAQITWNKSIRKEVTLELDWTTQAEEDRVVLSEQGCNTSSLGVGSRHVDAQQCRVVEWSLPAGCRVLAITSAI